MGALCVTYCVGGLSVCNSIAGAYAEKSPVVVITGSPGLRERIHNPLLHHMVRDFRTQYDVFEKLCVAGTELADPLTAFSEIDRVLATCARYKRPVYIEIPRDMVHVRPETAPPYKQPEVRSDTRALAEAVDEAVQRIAERAAAGALAGRRNSSLRPARGSREAGRGVAASRWPPRCSARASSPKRIRCTWASTKGRWAATRSPSMSKRATACIMLGTFMTDINLGIYTAELDLGDCIYVTSEAVPRAPSSLPRRAAGRFRAHAGQPASAAQESAAARADRLSQGAVHAAAERPITITRMIDRLDEQLEDDTVVIADVGDALFGATELTTRGKTEFISPAYYTSMGFAVPAALGVHVARPELRGSWRSSATARFR